MQKAAAAKCKGIIMDNREGGKGRIKMMRRQRRKTRTKKTEEEQEQKKPD